MPGITGTEWRCIQLIGPDGAEVALTDQPPSLLIAADFRVSGFAGVNRYFSTAVIASSKSPHTVPIAFGAVGATRMAGPPERMALEGAFTGVLERVRSATIAVSGDGAGGGRTTSTATLTLRGDAGTLARFVPASVPPAAP